ncbi:MAG: crossover junction endodeoxyribonuclease RuvC [Candidatus Liptonbacteria bacterium]|nr:crossover junction endodeoxyribonuclease RuvC [Candidatus Liptonbacteria bacterium]
MIILGIDPGSRRMGYGVVEQSGPQPVFVAAGVLPVTARTEPEALQEIKTGLDALLRKYRPSAVALEKLFFVRNQKTGIAVAQARGIALLAAAQKGLPVYEFAPNEIKAGITGNGAADKRAVLKMVRIILNQPALVVIDDASDALASALLAAQKFRNNFNIKPKNSGNSGGG